MYPAQDNRINDPAISGRIEDLMKKDLSVSDRNIIVSMREFFSKRSYLSEKQHRFFCSIEARYSDDRIKKSIEWSDTFDADKRARFDLACKYYKTTRYFTDIVNFADKNPAYIPTEKQYNNMCNNKYFEKAVENYNTPPKYSLADIVVFRDNKRSYHRDKSLVCLIEDLSEEGSFYKGQRSYKLLVIGQEDRISVVEDEIKLYREKKSV